MLCFLGLHNNVFDNAFFFFSGNIYALTEELTFLLFVFLREQYAMSPVGPGAWFEGDFTGSAQ